MYYLNLYYTVIKEEKGYSFVELGMSKGSFSYIDLNDKQEFVFKQLLEGKGIKKEFFQQIFGEELFEEWIKDQILLKTPIDQMSKYSRSKAFYWRNQCGNAQDILKKKKVLILGCGGIGSHVGWNLTALGVGELTLVDHDTVEISNLNRQLLYDEQDVGKNKVDVLKEKLIRINSEVTINAVCKMISSEADLEQLCMEKRYDLVIKSLDSPLSFSKWLDSVCEKHELKYISAIVMDSYPAVGPTYIPGKTLLHGEILKSDENRERIGGIAPSLGFMMHEMAGKVSEEAFKVLIDKGRLRYTNKIECTDCMNDLVFRFVGKNKKEVVDKAIFASIILTLFVFFIEGCFPKLRTAGNVFLMIYAIFGPFLISNDRSKINKLGIVNMFIFQFLNVIYMLPGIISSREWKFYEGLVFITSLFLAASITLFLIVMLQDAVLKIKGLKRAENI